MQRDVDFLWFEGLAAGTSFIAEGCFFPRAERGVRNRHDAAGTLIASNDDSGELACRA